MTQQQQAKKVRQNNRDQSTAIVTFTMMIISALYPDIPDGAMEGMTGLAIIMLHRIDRRV